MNTIKKIYLTTLVSFLITTFASFYYYLETHRYILQIEMAVDSDLDIATTQLFFDVGKSYNQEDSQLAPIISDNKFHTLSYRFPRKTVRGFRFDPLNTPGQILIKNIKICTHNKKLTITLNPARVLPLQGIASIDTISMGVQIHTTSGDDPSLLLDFPRPYLPNAIKYIDIKDLASFSSRLFFILGFVFFIVLTTIPRQSR